MIYPIRNIVAGISEIEKPDPVLAAALGIAQRTGATLHLVYAIDPSNLIVDPYPAFGGSSAVDLEAYRDDVQRQLESQIRALAPMRDPELNIVVGVPGDEILTAGNHRNADLIIVGASRQGRITRVFLGTTAARVVREAPVPVLVIRGPDIPHRRVLLATDLSTFSGEIHEVALDVVESFNGGEDPEIRSIYVSLSAIDAAWALKEDRLPDAIRDDLNEFLGRRRRRRYPVQGAVRSGDPSDEILAEAADWEADLVVVGTHGRKAPARWLLGSVAEELIRGALCNVLVIPVALAASRDLPVIREETLPTTAGR